MKRLSGEDWAVMGSLLFFSFVVLAILGIWRYCLLYWGIGSWILSMVFFGLALYLKDKY